MVETRGMLVVRSQLTYPAVPALVMITIASRGDLARVG